MFESKKKVELKHSGKIENVFEARSTVNDQHEWHMACYLVTD